MANSLCTWRISTLQDALAKAENRAEEVEWRAAISSFTCLWRIPALLDPRSSATKSVRLLVLLVRGPFIQQSHQRRRRCNYPICEYTCTDYVDNVLEVPGESTMDRACCVMAVSKAAIKFSCNASVNAMPCGMLKCSTAKHSNPNCHLIDVHARW